jgi:hypothetical protein
MEKVAQENEHFHPHSYPAYSGTEEETSPAKKHTDTDAMQEPIPQPQTLIPSPGALTLYLSAE